MRRLALVALAGLLAAVVFVAAAFAIYPRPLLQRVLAAVLGRDITIQAAEVVLGSAIVVTLSKVKVPNAAWADAADLLSIASLTVALDLKPLLRGEVRLRRVAVDGLRLLLERDPAGRGNWKLPGTASAAAPATTRPWLPTILALAVRDSGLELRTGSGALLHVFARSLTLQTDARDRPVSLVADIVYNDAPVVLSARIESFDAYANRTRRLGFSLAATTTAGRLELDAGADAPLDFDALADGLRADIPDIGKFAALFGSDLGLQIPLALAGGFSRNGDAWRLTAAHGTLAGSPLTADLALDEGARLQPDAVRTTLELADLDLDLVLGRMGKAANTRGGTSITVAISV
jgi:uncharacterized protein involved in outer membrane biogenesis